MHSLVLFDIAADSTGDLVIRLCASDRSGMSVSVSNLKAGLDKATRPSSRRAIPNGLSIVFITEVLRPHTNSRCASGGRLRDAAGQSMRG